MGGRESDDRNRVEKLRQEARRRWGGTDDDNDVENLAALLESDDARERAEAAWALAELAADDPDVSWKLPVESKIAPLLDDEDHWVRRGASWAIATVADEHPQRARTSFSKIVDGLTDEDPLVRENNVLTVSGVAAEYPNAAEAALTRLADLVHDDDGLVSQYAAQTLRNLVTRLDENGFPQTVETPDELASLLPEGVDVVEVTDDPSAGRPIQIRGSSQGQHPGDESDEERDDGQSLGPPDQIPSPPDINADHTDFEPLVNLGNGPLTTAAKARVSASPEGSQHVVVVLRTLRSDVTVAPDRFERALRAWAGVDDHDYVAPVLSRGPNPRPWFATEFFDGGTLREHVGSLGFDRAVWYAHCLVSVVCHAHARGVVHGALRPRVVGLSRTLGAWSVPKVGDWGFGELLADVQRLPVPPAFAAPEHVEPGRFGRTDPATDVYQLGALCYALFAGRPPFVGEASEVARKVLHEDPPPASEFARVVPPDLDALLSRALTKEKHARFETAEDFRRELELVAQDVPLSFEL